MGGGGLLLFLGVGEGHVWNSCIPVQYFPGMKRVTAKLNQTFALTISNRQHKILTGKHLNFNEQHSTDTTRHTLIHL